MKNIFLLSTNKESLLHKSHDMLITSTELTGKSDLYKSTPQFIYITNTEEVKAEDSVKDKWFISEYGFIVKAEKTEGNYLIHQNGGSNYLHFYKEVLLTNDTSLIEDGIQEVPSVFLSFFAENPVDYVEVFETEVYNETLKRKEQSLYSYKFPQYEERVPKDKFTEEVEK